MGRYFFITTFLLLSQAAHAGPFSKFFLKNSGRYNTWELERIENFIEQTEARMPQKMKDMINGIIPVDFVDFPEDQKQGLKFILIPKCTVKDGGQNAPKIAQKLGMANIKTNEIKINRLFLNEILLGPELSQKFNCRHRNLYKTAMGVLLHEAGHLFDKQAKVSTSDTFQSLMGFKKPWLFGKAQSRNKLQTRSPNPYEFADLFEAFSVNLEFFLLDSEFACRRPNINQYYEDVLQTQKRNCKPNYTVVAKDSTNGSSTQYNLDPQRLYSVDYLLADSGSQLMSYWGHAMFNLVFCAPGVPVGPKCREGSNLSHHIVVSFRANLTDLKLSYLKGLFGGYPSQPFLLSMTSVMREYNRLEKRNLESIPLNLTAQQKINFVGQVLEMYSSYMGEFRFLTNNCATESKELLKSIVRTQTVQDLGYSTPKGLLQDLIDIGLIHGNYKKKEYSFFESYSDKYKMAFAKLNNIAKKFNFKEHKLDDFIEMTAAQRMQWYNQIIKSQKDKKALLLLAVQVEQEIKEFEKQSFDKAVFEMMLKAIENPKDFDGKFSSKAKQLIEAITENLKRSERFSTSATGYGVLLPSDQNEGEFERIAADLTRRDLVDGLAFVRAECEKMFSSLDEEIKNTGKNIDALIQALREVIRKS